MDEDRVLTPGEAEAVVDERIEQFGPGSIPRVSVTETGDSRWIVRWDGIERVVVPMAMVAWRAWLEENVGSLDAGELETTES